jgi:hypothetical protein
LEKRKRNRSLYRYSLKRPKMSLENLGRVFGGISKQRVHAIIKREKTRLKTKLERKEAKLNERKPSTPTRQIQD